MKRILLMTAAVALVASPAWADWDHPVKWDQLAPDSSYNSPSSEGWYKGTTGSAYYAQYTTADDFLCDETGWITDIEFFGYNQRRSYGFGDYNYAIDTFKVTFWTDVPADANDASKPGTALYTEQISAADPNDPLKIGWRALPYDPPEYVGLYHFKIDLPEDKWFQQTQGNIYWISLQAMEKDYHLLPTPEYERFLWQMKDRNIPGWNDATAYSSTTPSYPPWYNYWLPGKVLHDGPAATGETPLDMSFKLTGIPEPGTLMLMGLGLVGLIRRR